MGKQKTKYSKKAERKKAERKSQMEKLRGDSTVEYSMPTEEHIDSRSKLAMQKNRVSETPKKDQTPNKKKHVEESKSVKTPEQKRKHIEETKTRKESSKKEQKARPELESPKEKTVSATTASTKTSRPNTEYVSSRKMEKKVKEQMLRERKRLQEMAVLQTSEVPICSKSAMAKIIRGIAQDVTGGETQIKFKLNALGVLHMAAEDYLTEIFHNAQLIASSSGKALDVPHIRLASLISNRQLHTNLSKKRKMEVLEDTKKGSDIGLYHAEEILGDATETDIKHLNIPSKFKHRPGFTSRKRRKIDESSSVSTSQVEEGYTSDSV